MSLPGYKTAKEAVPIIGRATATITKWCSQDMVPGAVKQRMGKTDVWLIPDETIEALAKQTPTRKEARIAAGRKTADKMRGNRRTPVTAPPRYPPATPKQIEHDATLAWIENLRRIV